jgi:hypothetical protein
LRNLLTGSFSPSRRRYKALHPSGAVEYEEAMGRATFSAEDCTKAAEMTAIATKPRKSRRCKRTDMPIKTSPRAGDTG